MPISNEVAEKIRDRIAYHDTFTIGYRTPGGTFIIASNKKWNDDNRPHDLAAILADGTVHQLRPTADPDFIARLIAVVGDPGDDEHERDDDAERGRDVRYTVAIVTAGSRLPMYLSQHKGKVTRSLANARTWRARCDAEGEAIKMASDPQNNHLTVKVVKL